VTSTILTDRTGRAVRGQAVPTPAVVTVDRIDAQSYRILVNGVGVGHLGLASSFALVNMSAVFGVFVKAHSSSVTAALGELTRLHPEFAVTAAVTV